MREKTEGTLKWIGWVCVALVSLSLCLYGIAEYSISSKTELPKKLEGVLKRAEPVGNDFLNVFSYYSLSSGRKIYRLVLEKKEYSQEEDAEDEREITLRYEYYAAMYLSPLHAINKEVTLIYFCVYRFSYLDLLSYGNPYSVVQTERGPAIYGEIVIN